MVRGEKPIELGDSWFSAKFIEVKRLKLSMGGRALAKKHDSFLRKLRILMGSI